MNVLYTVLMIFVFIDGGVIGYFIGILFHSKKIKNYAKTKCIKCKHFIECQGTFYRQDDDHKNCKMFIPKQEKPKKEDEDLKALKKAVENLNDDLDTLFFKAEEDDDSIERLNKEVFDNDD